eukprot:TRINITY_DN3061_c0_g1_i10.p1 TRINITY_DN3061_c0_g1~~TRINITY_DN3061_c0_g1_i10.p1  ORF type:complete len:169 (+),score=14.57 TRINITY_DN3061_c0_g1_i10:245-751(+)
MSVPSLFEIQQLSADQTSLLTFLVSYSHLAKCRSCCSQAMELRSNSSSSDGWRWKCHVCSRSMSVRANSVHSKSKQQLHQCLVLIFLWCFGCSNTTITAMTRISRPTVSSWIFWMQNAVSGRLSAETLRLGGPGEVVEVDESCWWRPKYNKGRNKTISGWVVARPKEV